MTNLRSGRPPLTDIAGSLRALADAFEDGEVAAETVVLVWDDPETIVGGACYGAMPSRFGLAGMLKVGADKASTGAWE